MKHVTFASTRRGRWIGWLALQLVAVGAYFALRQFAVGTSTPHDDLQNAYIGPGAGIALIGSVFTVLMAMISAFVALLTFPIRMAWRAVRSLWTYQRAQVKRVVVVGLDGLEPTLAEEFMAAGDMPNLARLRESGHYQRLGTTWPPLSPVAWSSFSTGTNPGKHNIYDFIARLRDYRPTISSVRIREPRRKLRLGGYEIPISKPEITALRKSRPFWQVLSDAGVFSAILRVPITFPPDKFKGVQLSAMCVPDLRGTQGMFSLFVEEGPEGSAMEGDVGGDRIRVRRERDGIHGYLRGPANSLRQDHAELRLPFVVKPSAAGEAVLHVGDEHVPLQVGKYTDWVRLKFKAAPGIGVSGICRFYLKRLEAPFELYATPLQIDPDKPVMPISHPAVYSSYLARGQGSFATLGLAEDTWSLSEKVLGEEAFLEQAYGIHAERERMFFDALQKVSRGVVVCVFDGPDRIQHMFWRFIDANHPAATDAERALHGKVIREMYKRMDGLVGRVMQKLDRKTALFVMSDHGFKPFRRGVDLNAWLRDNGYLVLKNGARTTEHAYLADIDWAKTRAYAVGLAGLFINQRGREEQGIVAPGEETRTLVREICGKLTGVRDDARNEVGVREAVPNTAVYRGPYTENAPDIIVGYNVGYRVAWDAAIGKCGEAIFSDNTKAWSGDHCVHPELVPGVLFSNRKLGQAKANIIDLGPTILELFGLKKPDYMDGASLLKAAGKEGSQAA